MAQKYSEIIKKNELMSVHTTFMIGGPADLFYEAKKTDDLIKMIKFCRERKIPFFILGNGSNILVSDEGFRGMVIKIKNSKLKIKNCKIAADAGVLLSKLVNLAKENSLTGLEFLAGIPGTIGGAVRGNAGAWQQSTGEKLLRVKVLTPSGKIKWLNRKDCQFGYRQSRFKKNKEIILEVELELVKGNKDKIEEKIDENIEKRKSDPKESSAGCVFINPKPNSAGDLIDQCGLRGRQIGRAQISVKHANWIVNLGGATADDVFQLIKSAKEAVKEKFGIELKEEICLLGFDKITL